MSEPVKEYGRIKLESVKKALIANNFDAYVAEDAEGAGRIVLEDIVPSLEGGVVSWGGSITLKECHIKRWFHENADWDVISVDEPGLDPDEKLNRRRQALLSDLYFLGTNAVTEDGILVNLDMIGNRVGALTFGPKKVVVLVGRNKICPDLFDAMERVRSYASPLNSMRLGLKNPCVKTASCQDCSSKQRICNNWSITEKSFPAGRTSVVLINQDLGL
jgi:hypothetical protein